MKVLLLGSYAPSLLTFRGPLIRDLLDAGYQVAVGVPDVPNDLRGKLEQQGVEVFATPLERSGVSVLADLAYYRHLCLLLSDLRPQVVLSYTAKPNIWGALAARRVGSRSFALVTGLGYAFTESGESVSLRRKVTAAVLRRLFRVALRHCEKVIFQNPDDLTDFVAMGCIESRDRCALVAGSGVDLEHYKKAPLSDRNVFLLVARLLGNKGIREFADAANIVMKRYPEAEFKIAGQTDPGPDAISDEELHSSRFSSVKFLGFQEDVRPWLAEARVIVLPSYREGTPRSVLEAMATGRAVITTDTPGCRETVAHGVNGLLVPARDAGSLADAMIWMLENPAKVVEMAEASHLAALKRFDVRLVNRDMIKILGGHSGHVSD